MATVAVLCSCSESGELDYDRLNRQAAQEYLTPIRSGYQGKMPFWNEFAYKFTYAPAFDFEEKEGAAAYRFTVKYIDDINDGHKKYFRAGMSVPTLEEMLGKLPDMKEGRTWTFTAASPKADLSPVWSDIPAGNVALLVEALDGNGDVIGAVGARKFLRDFPFHGPYHEAVRPYLEAARMAGMYVHTLPFISYWMENGTPDPSFKHNSYVCKTGGGTVQLEVNLAKLIPGRKEEFLAVARKVADFMISVAQGEDKPLAHFPPTYYKDFIRVAVENAGQTMTMEPTLAAKAYLDLFDATAESKYYDEALAIARTYCRIQGQDGSFPIKMYEETGEPVNGVKASPYSLLELWRRFDKQYGCTEFRDNTALTEKWMFEVAIPRFDLTGQFEDVGVNGLKPFQNLTNVTYAFYAKYIYENMALTDENRELCRDMMALAEDQFVYWDHLKYADGFKMSVSPCVFEQYQYQTPIDASAANMVKAFLAQYHATGDRLAFAKAKALADACTIAQDPNTGRSNTHWEVVSRERDKGRTIWINCTNRVMTIWMMMDAELNGTDVD